MLTEWYPEAERGVPVNGGGDYVGGSARGVIHSTETTWWHDDNYHIMYHPVEKKFRQLIPFNVAGRGLRNGPDPVQTNRQGSVCIQLALIGYASRLHQELDDEDYLNLGKFFLWCEREWGIKPTFPHTFQDSSAAGTGGAGRLTVPQWETVEGWVGHQDVPDTNTHWDPGKISTTKLVEGVEMATELEKDQAFVRELRLAVEADEGKASTFRWIARLYRAFLAKVNLKGVEAEAAVDKWWAEIEATGGTSAESYAELTSKTDALQGVFEGFAESIEERLG